MEIFHITTPESWQQAKALGEYRTQSLEQEGFIHCSTQSQVTMIANTFYSNYDELILLKINPKQLLSEVKWEPPVHPNPNQKNKINDDEQFPHIYGHINLDAVTQIMVLKKTSKEDTFVIA